MAQKSGYKSSQPRDKNGRWTSGGSGTSGKKTPSRGGSSSVSGKSKKASPKTSGGMDPAAAARVKSAKSDISLARDIQLPTARKMLKNERAHYASIKAKIPKNGYISMKVGRELADSEGRLAYLGREITQLNNSINAAKVVIKNKGK